MSHPTQAQLQALTALLHQLRHDWDLPGIRSALTQAATLSTAADLAVAACRVAGNPDARTPGLIPQPGQHWQGTAAGSRPVQVMCAEHPRRKASHCPECVAAAVPKPATFVVPARVFEPRNRSEWVPPENKPRQETDATPTETATETVSK